MLEVLPEVLNYVDVLILPCTTSGLRCSLPRHIALILGLDIVNHLVAEVLDLEPLSWQDATESL